MIFRAIVIVTKPINFTEMIKKSSTIKGNHQMYVCKFDG